MLKKALATTFFLLLFAVIVMAADVTTPLIDFENGTPSNDTTQYIETNDSIFINVSASDSEGNVSLFMEFDDSVKGWWRMDDLNATNDPYDYFEVYNGSVHGSPTQITGYIGKAFDFPGGNINDYIIIDHEAMDGLGDFSVSLYLRKDDNDFEAVVSGANSGNSNDFLMFTTQAEMRIYLQNIYDAWTIDISDGDWHHIVFTRNETIGTIYVDGVSKGTNTVSDTTLNIDPGGFVLAQEQDSVGGGFDANQALNGAIDDVIVFNYALSTDEVIALYANETEKLVDDNHTSLAVGDYNFAAYAQDNSANVNTTGEYTVTLEAVYPTIDFEAGTPSNGSTQYGDNIYVNVSANNSEGENVSIVLNFDDSLVSWYRMDDIDGSGNPDDYMDRNDLTKVGTAAQTSDGYLGDAFTLDGNSDYLTITASSSLDITGNITLTAWAKGTLSATTSVLVCRFYRSSANWAQYCMGYGSSTLNNTFLHISDDVTNDYGIYYPPNSYDPEDWHHIAYTWNGTYIDTYNDGVRVNSTPSSIAAIQSVPSAKFNIGADAWTVDRYFFNGEIDDVMVFNRSLSSDEVAALYADQSNKYLEENFTHLSYGWHDFIAYAQDESGNVNSTSLREVNLTSDDCYCHPYNSNWVVDMTKNCQLPTCDIGNGNMTFTGAGWANCTGTIDMCTLSMPSSNSILWISQSTDCHIRRGNC